jgi:hypothetical protein
MRYMVLLLLMVCEVQGAMEGITKAEIDGSFESSQSYELVSSEGSNKSESDENSVIYYSDKNNEDEAKREEQEYPDSLESSTDQDPDSTKSPNDNDSLYEDPALDTSKTTGVFAYIAELCDALSPYALPLSVGVTGLAMIPGAAYYLGFLG